MEAQANGTEMITRSARRVSFDGDWLGAFRGESQAKALEREVAQLNAEGCRVVIIVPDRWSFFRRVLWLMIVVGTLGFIVRSENLLLIGEHVDGPPS